MTKKNVLYLSYDGLTDPLGQSQVLPYILGLCKEGYAFDIVSFEKPDNYKKEEVTIRKIISGSAISWHPQVYHKKPPIISTLLDLRRMWIVSSELAGKKDLFLVHARSYLAGLIGLKLKRKRGIKFLFDIRGFWADERVDGGLWNLSNPIYNWIYRFFKKKEIDMMHGADHVISLTHAGKEEIVSGNLFNGRAEGLSSDKITVIPCAVDLELFDRRNIIAEDQKALKKELDLAGAEKILVYLGSLGTWYMLDEMLLFFKNYLSENPQSYFLLVTKDDPKIIHSAADRIGLDTMKLRITSSSRQLVPLHLSIATIGIFFIKPAYSKKASSAVKMGELLALQLPIITNEIGDVNQFQAVPLGYISTISIVKILPFENNDILSSYSLENGVTNYLKIYEKIVGQGYAI